MPAVATKPTRRYQVLAGRHIDAHPTVKDAMGKAVDRVTIAPDIVETAEDLEAKFNVPGFTPKFRRVMDNDVQAYQPPPKPKVVDLSAMDDAKLTAFAAEQDIDVKGCKNKDEKLKAIRAALSE